jgi:hypothetical protein
VSQPNGLSNRGGLKQRTLPPAAISGRHSRELPTPNPPNQSYTARTRTPARARSVIACTNSRPMSSFATM